MAYRFTWGRGRRTLALGVVTRALRSPGTVLSKKQPTGPWRRLWARLRDSGLDGSKVSTPLTPLIPWAVRSASGWRYSPRPDLLSHRSGCPSSRAGRRKESNLISVIFQHHHRHHRRLRPAGHPGFGRIEYEAQNDSRELPVPVGEASRGRRRQGTMPFRLKLRAGCRWTQKDRMTVLWTVGSYGPRAVALRAIGLAHVCVADVVWMPARWKLTCMMSVCSCSVRMCS